MSDDQAPAKDPLDREALDKLRQECVDMGDADLFASLIELFTAGAPGQLAAMKEALATKDGESLARGAHTLRGSAATLAVVNVRAVCTDLEAAADRGDFEAAAAQLAQLEQEYALAESALSRELEERPI